MQNEINYQRKRMKRDNNTHKHEFLMCFILFYDGPKLIKNKNNTKTRSKS